MKSLAGKVAIVTGAGRGVGRAHALLLAQQGAKVVVNDLGGSWNGEGEDTRVAQQVVEEIRSAGGEAVANFDNVAIAAGAQAMINQAIDTFGGLDILINNAGILRDKMSFNMEEAEWDAVMTVHLKGHFLPTRYAAAYWRNKAKSTGQPADATIILTSSESGLYGNPGQLNYDAAKAGIASMAIAIARELERYGVRSFAICPRARTRLTEGTFGEFGPSAGGFDEWDPAHVSPMVVWLCTDAAKSLNGQVFVIGGGTVQLMQSWTAAAEISQNRQWTLKELDVAVEGLMAGHARQPLPIPMPKPN